MMGLQQQNFGIYSAPNKIVIHPTKDLKKVDFYYVNVVS